MTLRMVALVVGNSAYQDAGALKNPVNDANDLAEKLTSYGFHVLVATDASCAEMEAQLEEFGRLLGSYDVALFFFAGHGMQIKGTNYLLAIDTHTSSEINAKYTSLSLDKVIETMAQPEGAAMKIVILDACRNNPWERAWHRGPELRGLASVYAPKGTIIGFATSPGEVAQDGVGRNGTYTAALLQHIDAPDCSIETMFKRVRNTIAAETKGEQTSWEHTSLAGEFYFRTTVSQAITEYQPTSLADRLLVLDPAKKSHSIIAALKSHNWYQQNRAIKQLTASFIAKMSPDSLFVIGRNLYQAAEGDATDAVRFIENFLGLTADFPRHQRSALLDGMLFEVFFNAKGELRAEIKATHFNQLFELEAFPDCQDSFEFIHDALVAARANFYVVPGKNRELGVSVAAGKADGGYQISGIFVDTFDVLRPDDEEWDVPVSERHFEEMSRTRLVERLSHQMVVPARLLRLSFTPAPAGQARTLLFPYGWNVRKI